MSRFLKRRLVAWLMPELLRQGVWGADLTEALRDFPAKLKADREALARYAQAARVTVLDLEPGMRFRPAEEPPSKAERLAVAIADDAAAHGLFRRSGLSQTDIYLMIEDRWGREARAEARLQVTTFGLGLERFEALITDPDRVGQRPQAGSEDPIQHRGQQGPDFVGPLHAVEDPQAQAADGPSSASQSPGRRRANG